jgi:hypothetical protein
LRTTLIKKEHNHLDKIPILVIQRVTLITDYFNKQN